MYQKWKFGNTDTVQNQLFVHSLLFHRYWHE